jgi:hypothetical protein
MPPAATSHPAGLTAARPVRSRLSLVLKQGMSPREVGGQVLAAIREDRFYILTHPDWNTQIEHRMKTILAGENPNPLPPPGFELLMQRLAAVAEPKS